MVETQTAADYWESRYSESERIWSGRVNHVLSEVASALTPGSALDLGCGEGGDAVWLAQHGWAVTGVDLSLTAIERGRLAAAELGIAEERIRFEAADLSEWTSEQGFDLVTCSFLHSWPVIIPREEILHRSARFVAPGGHLLITSHASAPSWSDHELVHGHVFPTPESDLEALDLDVDRWQVLTCALREREATAPDGTSGMLADGIVLARRLS